MTNLDSIELIAQPISITEAALRELKRLISADETGKSFLRFGVAPGGCAGMSYTMAFVTDKGKSDREYRSNGLAILIDREAIPLLSGLVLDFKDALVGGGFKFSNPNARRSCGCGTSFRC